MRKPVVSITTLCLLLVIGILNVVRFPISADNVAVVMNKRYGHNFKCTGNEEVVGTLGNMQHRYTVKSEEFPDVTASIDIYEEPDGTMSYGPDTYADELATELLKQQGITVTDTGVQISTYKELKELSDAIFKASNTKQAQKLVYEDMLDLAAKVQIMPTGYPAATMIKMPIDSNYNSLGLLQQVYYTLCANNGISESDMPEDYKDWMAANKTPATITHKNKTVTLDTYDNSDYLTYHQLLTVLPQLGIKVSGDIDKFSFELGEHTYTLGYSLKDRDIFIMYVDGAPQLNWEDSTQVQAAISPMVNELLLSKTFELKMDK